METEITSGGLLLKGHLALPPPTSGGPGLVRHGLVLCHAFPPGIKGARTTGQTYPMLAERLAADAGWAVLTFNFRGTGDSPGDFSLGGWLEDVRAAIDHLPTVADVDGVWLAGFATGGSLALCAAGEDDRVRGVAAFAAPADFDDWANDPKRFLDHARAIGVVRTNGFPPDVDAWGRELREIRPVALVGKIPPRPLLIAHGTEDDVVSIDDARVLFDAAENEAELRLIKGGGHRLRHDPRGVAVLMGWLDRQTL